MNTTLSATDAALKPKRDEQADALAPIRAEHARFARLLTLFGRLRWASESEIRLRLPLLIEALSYIRYEQNEFHHAIEDQLFEAVVAHLPEQRARVNRMHKEHAELGRLTAKLHVSLLEADKGIENDALLRDLAQRLDAFAAAWRAHIDGEEDLLYCEDTRRIVGSLSVNARKPQQDPLAKDSYALLAEFMKSGDTASHVQHGAGVSREASAPENVSAAPWQPGSGSVWPFIWHDGVLMFKRNMSLLWPRHPSKWAADLVGVTTTNFRVCASWSESVTKSISPRFTGKC